MTVEIYEGDCLDILPTFAEQSIDSIITDLPYQITQAAHDIMIPFAPMWREVKRLLKPGGVFVTTASQPFSSQLVCSNLEWFKYEWIWHKDLATGHLNAHRRPMMNHESVLVFSSGNELYQPQGLRGYGRPNRRGGNGDNYGVSGLINWQEYTNYPRTVLDFSVHRSVEQHATQKPLALYEYLILIYTLPGALVLDFTMGSATTGCAAIKLGRSFIGIEKDAAIFAMAAKRIQAAQDQLSLF